MSEHNYLFEWAVQCMKMFNGSLRRASAWRNAWGSTLHYLVHFTFTITDRGPGMRILTRIGYFALVALLVACDQQHSAPDVDPMLGRECFESHRASLAPGAQYEGIDKLTGDTLTIKVMSGVDVVGLECRLKPDGTLGNAVK